MALVGEDGPLQGSIEEYTGRIPGEHAPGTIGTVCTGRQPDDQDARSRIAETRHRPAPIIPVAESALALACDLFTICHQAWAQAAGNDLLIERFPGRCGHAVDFSPLPNPAGAYSSGGRRALRAPTLDWSSINRKNSPKVLHRSLIPRLYL